MPVCHVLYGLRVASDLALPGLVVCNEPGTVDLRIRLKERKKFASKFSASLSHVSYTSPHSNGKGETILRVGTLDDGRYIGFFYSDGARFAIEHQGREIWADWPENYTLEDACTYIVGPVIAFALRLRGTTCLHASSIAVGGQAIALLGQPGAGKSTTAAAFAHLGYPILSDDVAVLDEQGDRFLVQPGYPRVNLWPDSVRALFGSEDALPHITPTWGKHFLALDRDERRFQSQPMPLGAIFLLRDRIASAAAPRVEPMAPASAFPCLVANTYLNYLLDWAMRKREFVHLGRLLKNTPVYQVWPTDDPSRVFELCEAIAAEVQNSTIRAGISLDASQNASGSSYLPAG